MRFDTSVENDKAQFEFNTTGVFAHPVTERLVMEPHGQSPWYPH